MTTMIPSAEYRMFVIVDPNIMPVYHLITYIFLICVNLCIS